jgi:hypothetical protein
VNAGVHIDSDLGMIGVYQRNLDLHITPLIGLTKLSAIRVPFVPSRVFQVRLRTDMMNALHIETFAGRVVSSHRNS